jgi:hypothetical protein
MEAKKIYEAISDLLTPKSEIEVAASTNEMLGPYKNLIDECYEFIQSHKDHFEIADELGWHYDGYSNWYGFIFINLLDEKQSEYALEFYEEDDYKHVVLNQKNGEAWKEIKNIDDLLFNFNVYEPIEEGISSVLTPKSMEEMRKVLPEKAEELVDECYQIVLMNANYNIEVKLGFHEGLYGFQFCTVKPLETGNEYHLGEIGEYTLGYVADYKRVMFYFENNGHDEEIHNIEDFQSFLTDEFEFEPTPQNESVEDALKPKPQEEIAENLLSNMEILGDKRNDLMDAINNFNSNDFTDKLDAFIYLMSNEYLISAMEIYLSDVKQRPLFNLFNKGYDIATYAVDYDEYGDEDDDYDPQHGHVPPIAKYMKKLGWDKFHFEDNMDQAEFIFVKPPQVNEDLAAVFKPKPEQLVALEYAKKYPIFARIFYHMFPTESFDVKVDSESNRASAHFGFTSGGKKFLVNQDEYHPFPQITYLETRGAQQGFGGVFTGHRYVKTHDDIINYVKHFTEEE